MVDISVSHHFTLKVDEEKPTFSRVLPGKGIEKTFQGEFCKKIALLFAGCQGNDRMDHNQLRFELALAEKDFFFLRIVRF